MILLGGDVVSSWTGTLGIHSGILNSFIHTQNFCHFQGKENDKGQSTTPNDDKGDLSKVCTHSITCGHEFNFTIFLITCCAEPTPAMVLISSGPKVEECSSDATPNATCTMH